MKALFVGPLHSRELEVYSDAWNCWNEIPARTTTYAAVGERCDEQILADAAAEPVDVIFYIGAAGGSGVPLIETFRTLRGIGHTIHLVCDSADSPWHPFLREYAENECFDLQVGLDGPLNAPVDLATLPPINPAAYDTQPAPERNIRCGFAGQFMKRTNRGQTILQLVKHGALTYVSREIAPTNADKNPYSHYTNFLRRCKIAFNHGWTSFDQIPTVKWRVIEGALAGCAVLENDSAPVDHWFPKGSVFHYKDADQAHGIIRHRSDSEIADVAAKLSERVRRDFSPQTIYGEMLAKVGL